MRTNLAALALLLASACAEDKVVSLPLHLEASSCDLPEGPGAPLFCGGTLVVELFEVTDVGPQLIKRHCSNFAPDLAPEGLSSLDALLTADPPRFPALSEGRVMVRAALFSPAVLSGCPPLGDDPSVSEMRVPIVQGDSLVVDVGNATQLDVGLDCFASVPFICEDENVILPTASRLSATVVDLGTLAVQGDGLAQIASVDVGLLNSVDADGTVPGPDGMALFGWFGSLNYGGSGIWTTQLDYVPPGLCTQVMRRDDPPIVSCDSRFSDVDAYATGYTLDEDVRDEILRAIGATQSPARGMVIGRVVDSQRHPVAGAEVGDLNGLMNVKTPRADFTGLTANGRTDAGGWFVIDELGFAPLGRTCCESLVATTPDLKTAYTELLGLVDGSITATVIELPEL